MADGLTDAARAEIREAIRIVREDRFEKYVREKHTSPTPPGPTPPTPPGPTPPTPPGGPTPPPPKDNPPPTDPPKKSGLWWGDRLSE